MSDLGTSDPVIAGFKSKHYRHVNSRKVDSLKSFEPFGNYDTPPCQARRSRSLQKALKTEKDKA